MWFIVFECCELFLHRTETMRCLQKEMATYRHWSVSLWTDDVSYCRILSPDKTEWRLISATLCGRRRCFVADQLCFVTRIREEEDCVWVKNREVKIQKFIEQITSLSWSQWCIIAQFCSRLKTFLFSRAYRTSSEHLCDSFGCKVCANTKLLTYCMLCTPDDKLFVVNV